jgi:cysteine-rich repeat protein
LVAATLLLSARALVAQEAGGWTFENPIGRSQPRIVNGLLTSLHPTTGALLTPSNPNLASTWCSATLIGCRTVLTAAHCVQGSPSPSNYAVFLQHAGIFSVASVTIHPNFSFPVADLAVLRLSSDVTGIAPTPINTLQQPALDTPGTIAGFGRSGGSNDDYGIKRYGDVTTASCPSGVSNSTSVCWRFSSPQGPAGSNSNTCNADSGGPLFMDFGSGEVLAGVTSGGTSDSCLPTDFSYDTNVYFYRSWIATQAGSDLENTTCGDTPQVGDPDAQVFDASGQLSGASPQALHSFVVPAGATELRVAMNAIDDGLSNFNLYVRAGTAPTTSTYDCAAVGSNQFGFCDFASPAPGTWYVLLNRLSGAGTYQVTATMFGVGCSAPGSDGQPCNDHSSCTANDVCSGGVCGGSSTCGDGIVQPGCEQCDDGNLEPGDGCEPDCTPTPIFDAMVVPPRPLNVTIAAGEGAATKTLRVLARHASPTGSAPQPIRLVVTSADCPSGTIDGAPDFDARTGGAQASTVLIAGGSRMATIPLRFTAGAFTSPNYKAPERCTLDLDVAVDLPGNVDPSPKNNSVTVELNVIDKNVSEQATSYESVLYSLSPLTLYIQRGIGQAQRSLRAMVMNADILPARADPGHDITVTVNDGDCPAGAVGLVDFDRLSAGTQSTVIAKGGLLRSGSFPVVVDATAFTSFSGRSPVRCTALVTATGPAGGGEPEATNNVTRLIIDVVDRNDF